MLYISQDEKRYNKNRKAISDYKEKIRKNQEAYNARLKEMDEKENTFLKITEEKILAVKEEKDKAKEKLELLMENEAKEIEALGKKINMLKEEIASLKSDTEN